MKIKLTWMKWPIVFSIMIFAPMIAYGGLLDWLLPVKELAKVGRDITMAVMLKSFLDQWMPLIGTLLIAGCGITCFWGAIQASNGFSSAFKVAMEDHKITWKEGIGLIAIFPVTTAVALVLLWYGGVFTMMASSALLRMATSVPQ